MDYRGRPLCSNIRFDGPQYRLSALSFKTFERMKEYIFIEETVSKQTLIWLVKKQKSNGCFRRDEKLVNNAQEVRGSQGVCVICLCCLASSEMHHPWECHAF